MRTDQPDENGLEWRTSDRETDPDGGVQLAVILGGDGVLVRDGSDRTGPSLIFTADELRAFIAGVKAGEFDELL